MLLRTEEVYQYNVIMFRAVFNRGTDSVANRCGQAISLGKRKVSKEKTRENHLTGRAKCGLARNSTNRGTTPQAMMRSMGGSSLESRLRNILVATS